MPSALNFSELKKENNEANLELAFTTAEKVLDIPRFLDPQDMRKLF